MIPIYFVISPIATCLPQAGLPKANATKARLEFQLGYIARPDDRIGRARPDDPAIRGRK